MNLNLNRFFSLPFWLQVLHTFLQTCQRFPLVIISLLLGIGLALDEVHKLGIFDANSSYKLFLAAFCGALWFTASTLFAENRQWTNKHHYKFSVPIFLLFCWNIYSLQSSLTLDVWGSVLAAGLAISFAAWLFRSSDNASVWYFNYQLIAAICFAAIATVILCGGISLILVSIKYLFEIEIPSRLYGDVWLIGSMFLAPVYFLAQIPKQFNFARSDCSFPKGVHFILTYVLVPLTLIYMVILYAYLIKIVLITEMPHGYLSTMISLFAVVGIITHLAVYPIHDRGNAIIAWFYRNFYRVMIVPLGLLILAIGQRISQYGITEQRYLVAACTLWFAILIIYALIKRQQFRLQFVTISLAVLSLAASFGPWSIYNLPINSQLSRLEAIFIDNKLLIDGKVFVEQQPDFDSLKEISSIVSYLVKHNASHTLRPWIKDQQAFDKEFNCQNTTSCYHFDGQKALEFMALSYVDYWQSPSSRSHQQITLKKEASDNNTFAISGYDFFMPIEWFSRGNKRPFSLKVNGLTTKLHLHLNDEGQLLINSQNNELLRFDLTTLLPQFSESHTSRIEIIDADKLMLTHQGNKLSGKLYLNQLSLTDGKIDFIAGGLLIKLEGN